ncbi:MAG: MFS transporter [Bdellovibrionota bacterium]
MQQQNEKIAKGFVALMAVLMSFVALSIDAMMPALGTIGRDFGVANPNYVQFVISSIFLGMGAGLMLFGPFSDAWGRKPALYIGISIFLFGCILAIFSRSFEMLIVGRLFQGFGAASCRVVTLALIRDKYRSNQMAKVMSFIMIIFIMVPAFAPSIGQGILYIAHWRFIFVFILVLGMLGSVWLFFGQQETLHAENRIPFSKKRIWQGLVETLQHDTTWRYMVASGLVFGALIGYLSSAQQILQIKYNLGDKFAIAFGVLALMVGIASFANTKWVDRFGMEVLCKKALQMLTSISGVFLLFTIYYHGVPPLFFLLGFLGISFFLFRPFIWQL